MVGMEHLRMGGRRRHTGQLAAAEDVVWSRNRPNAPKMRRNLCPPQAPTHLSVNTRRICGGMPQPFLNATCARQQGTAGRRVQVGRGAIMGEAAKRQALQSSSALGRQSTDVGE
jgi:hypothetical protein